MTTAEFEKRAFTVIDNINRRIDSMNTLLDMMTGRVDDFKKSVAEAKTAFAELKSAVDEEVHAQRREPSYVAALVGEPQSNALS